MPGRHRRHTRRRHLAQNGVLGLLVGAPLLLTGTALANPSGSWAAPDRRSPDRDHDEDDSLGSDDDHPDDDHPDHPDEDDLDEDDHHDEAPAVRSAGYRDEQWPSTEDNRFSERKWDRLAECESSQDWEADTGNGYRGGLQFSQSTWREFGGQEYAPRADQASREEQIEVAERVQREQGWQAWPSCSRQLGYA